MSTQGGPTAPFPVDLQLHSTCSDGTETPTELVRHCARLGIRVMALTDHDSVLGVEEALAAGREHGVTVVPAIEFSTAGEAERDFLDINILAYGIRHRDPALLDALEQIIASRVEQKIRQIERLQAYGLNVPVDEVLALAGGVPGRVHIARVALAHHPERFRTIQDVFDQFLSGDAVHSTYVPRSFSLRVEEAIELAHTAGGVAVLAHPGSYTRVRDVESVIRRLHQAGLDGLEIRYPYAQNRGHRGADEAQVAALIAGFDALADELGLLKTGGSDYHGTTKPGIQPGQAGLTWEEWVAVRPYLLPKAGLGD
ncbi:PHP domain-containing protein [Litorilinea aerophila]|uniref:PHP domain-containing protein n=1 Tax=Litorilinea aerophila TaxID=1204385 RepID=A0A540V9S6_9CHLR|nr:PHP domain-containing protein [Litorilinea aerophila]MCC9078610.1 PHP domain-containing protein [Litorilinea aerophila]GIV77061.1 MAG: phosphatase [Litorilinea sp.]